MTGGKEKENSEELGNQLFGGIDDLFIKITITQRQSATKIDQRDLIELKKRNETKQNTKGSKRRVLSNTTDKLTVGGKATQWMVRSHGNRYSIRSK